MADKNLTRHFLSDLIQTFPATGRYWIGYSGGIDSHVLLHLINTVKDEIHSGISAVHVDHGISRNSSIWSEHCRQVCNQLGVSFQNIKIDAACPDGESLENWARQQRYTAIANLFDQDDILLMAHNRDDQTETVFLQLLRGAGPRGLASMPVIRRFDKGWLARPLLGYSRQQILDYAESHQLKWIDDETNSDTNYDRNYIRQVVIPVMQRRWPGLSRVISRAARHQSEIIEFLEETAAVDLGNVRRKEINALDMGAMKSFSDTRIKNLITYWLKEQDFPPPGSDHLNHILSDVINSSPDATPCVKWTGTEMRRFKTLLFVQQPLPSHNPAQRFNWAMEKPVELALGTLEAKRQKGRGIAVDTCRDGIVEVRFRRGGERLRPADRKNTHELKKLFQEYGVLPWYRDRIPLLYIRDKLAAVAGLWIDKEFYAGVDQESWQIRWTGAGNIFCNGRESF